MIGLPAQLSRLAAILYASLLSLGPVKLAQAEELPITFFMEGVLGGSESTSAGRLRLLPSPRLDVQLYRLPGEDVSAPEKDDVLKEEQTIAGALNAFTAKLLSFQGPFVLHANEEFRIFAPEALHTGQLAVIFADAFAEKETIRTLLSSTYQRLRLSHPDVRVGTTARNVCGLFLFTTRDQILSSILIAPISEKRGTATYCVHMAILETVGFRGSVKSLSDGACKSVRCEKRARTMIEAWDAMAISALYGIEDPTPLSAIYRFKELLKATQQSSQSAH